MEQDITKEKLQELINKNYTLTEMEKFLGVSNQKIYYRMKKFGLTTNFKKKVMPTKEELKKYLDEKLLIKDIAIKLHIHRSTIFKYLKIYGLRDFIKDKTKEGKIEEELKKLIVLPIPKKEIAKKLGLLVYEVDMYLAKMDIPFERKNYNPPKEIVIGMKIGKLTVLENIIPCKGDINRYGKWLCICDCGNKKELFGDRLNRKPTKSCGCLSIERARENIKIASDSLKIYVEATINYQYTTHKNAAKEMLSQPLLKEDWKEIVLQPCYYCGKIDTRNYKIKRKEGILPPEEIKKFNVEMNGVDRLDSSKGYIKENCVSCCRQCNWMKNDYSKEEFFNKILEIVEHSKLK